MDNLQYHFEDIEAFEIPSQELLSQSIVAVLNDHNYTLDQLNYILCSDDYLLTINKEYLNHDYFTDVITFDLSEDQHQIEGDIFISIDRIKDQSLQFNVKFAVELHRVMIHGLLHLVGYNDKNEDQQNEMTAKENQYLLLK